MPLAETYDTVARPCFIGAYFLLSASCAYCAGALLKKQRRWTVRSAIFVCIFASSTAKIASHLAFFVSDGAGSTAFSSVAESISWYAAFNAYLLILTFWIGSTKETCVSAGIVLPSTRKLFVGSSAVSFVALMAGQPFLVQGTFYTVVASYVYVLWILLFGVVFSTVFAAYGIKIAARLDKSKAQRATPTDVRAIALRTTWLSSFMAAMSLAAASVLTFSKPGGAPNDPQILLVSVVLGVSRVSVLSAMAAVLWPTAKQATAAAAAHPARGRTTTYTVSVRTGTTSSNSAGSSSSSGSRDPEPFPCTKQPGAIAPPPV